MVLRDLSKRSKCVETIPHVLKLSICNMQGCHLNFDKNNFSQNMTYFYS